MGCFAIGILMVPSIGMWVAQRLLRPVPGIGVLDGFTTFSTCLGEVRRLLESGAAVHALGFFAGAVVASQGG
ncbi:CrcB family protein [Nocardia sp. NPDC051321]|uniref:CrcB family protein n=1 Tax=Nocardia sp. NPDC051321 TaxID=3364323 RepID=UPI003797A237